MAFEPIKLAAEQVRILKASAMLAIGDPDHGYSGEQLQALVPNLAVSGIGEDIDRDDWPGLTIDSPEFAGQVERARELFRGCVQTERAPKHGFNAWHHAHAIGALTGKPLCTGAFILGALIEGISVSHPRGVTGNSRLSVTSKSLRTAINKLR